MATSSNNHALPIYTTSGSLGALMKYPYLYNPQGEWIGWVTKERCVYSVHGHYVGWISTDPRILKSRSNHADYPRLSPPATPPRIRPPVSVPLPPMMSELKYSEIDVLEDQPSLLPTLDAGELREDMD